MFAGNDKLTLLLPLSSPYVYVWFRLRSLSVFVYCGVLCMCLLFSSDHAVSVFCGHLVFDWHFRIFTFDYLQ